MDNIEKNIYRNIKTKEKLYEKLKDIKKKLRLKPREYMIAVHKSIEDKKEQEEISVKALIC